MRDHPVSAAPDYTNAALTMMGVNMTWIFFALWAAWGFMPVLLLALAINHVIGRWQIRRLGR